jgi:hypothetical protein
MKKLCVLFFVFVIFFSLLGAYNVSAEYAGGGGSFGKPTQETDNEEDTMILLVPKTLGLMLKLDGPKEIKANGYKTVNGTKLTKNFVDTMIYANELREWLGTTVIRFKIHGSDILYPNEKRLINDCWNALNKMTNTKGKYNKNKKVERPAQAPQKPANVNVVFNNEIDELF